MLKMLFPKTISLLSATFIMAFSAYAQVQSSRQVNLPLFSHYSYQGKDSHFEQQPLAENEFYAQVLQGCYPDPSITRKGNDYYLVNSSFAMFPGVPIFHSHDLVNWKQIGHVLDRPSQLRIEHAGISEGIYAPDIKYNPYNDTFYMLTTQIAGGIGNMLVKTKDPAKGWSEPIKLNFDGIDPSIFFDDDGKAYVLHNDAPPKGTELYEGHRVIRIWEYDLKRDQVIAGTDQVIVNGGTDISQRPIWIEGPHLYKKDGKYYLMCAEGGTGDWHSEVIFIGEKPTGPFKPAANNPILSQRHLSKNRPNKIDWAGHADIVEGPGGKYFGVFLAVRPNDQNRVNTGRETFILPVDWSGTFPVFENGLVPLKTKLKTPNGIRSQNGQNGYLPTGNYGFSDDFEKDTLDMRWIAVRGPREKFVEHAKKGLLIYPSDQNIKARKPMAALFHRQQHLFFESTATLNYQPENEKELAGMVCYQNERFNYVFGVTKIAGHTQLVLSRTEKGQSTLLAQEQIALDGPIVLKIKGDGDRYSFRFSQDGGKSFRDLGETVSGDILSTDVAGGFTGNLIGLYAASANDIGSEK